VQVQVQELVPIIVAYERQFLFRHTQLLLLAPRAVRVEADRSEKHQSRLSLSLRLRQQQRQRRGGMGKIEEVYLHLQHQWNCQKHQQ
jgi:hypothetical protein